MDQRGIVSRNQALTQMSADALRHRIAHNGRWQRVLPGIYAGFTGALDGRQRQVAALLYGGAGSMLTAETALGLCGARISRPDLAHVLIPATRQRISTGFVRVFRTHRQHEVRVVQGLPCAPPARALSDWARGQHSLDAVRAVTASVVQRGLCDVATLEREIEETARRGSALLRRAVEEVAIGLRSPAEAWARRAIVKSTLLPEPLWNPRLFLDGVRLAEPDGYWHEAGLVSEVDSAEWHLGAREYSATMQRRARLEAAGLRVIANLPRRWRDEPHAALRELERTYQHGLRNGPPPGITVIPRRCA